MAARRSSPATSACCAPASPMRGISGTGPRARSSPTACRRSTRVTFHAKLGSQGERVRRLERWPRRSRRWSAPTRRWRARAALLAKADLTTGMVGEFPELQGVMGRYYARHDGEDARGRRRRSATITRRRGRATRCRPRRVRSRSRWPTSSICWPASSPSARSRPARAIPMRCAAPRSASSASCARTGCACLRSLFARQADGPLAGAARSPSELLDFFADACACSCAPGRAARRAGRGVRRRRG